MEPDSIFRPRREERDNLGRTTERTLDDGTSDELIREEPLMLRISGEPLLTMRTPGDDAALGLGFVLSEGLVTSPADVLELSSSNGELVIALVATAAPRVKQRLARTHEIRASCGLCGLRDAEHLLDDLPPLLSGSPKLELERLAAFEHAFRARQAAFSATGGCHAAALFAQDGTVLGFGEDVGRHNALDKAIGFAARAGHPLERAIAMLSGRAGFDLVLKCLRLRVPVVLSMSAPSSLGFDLCEQSGATLIGFVRDGKGKVYTDSGRIA